MKQQEKIMLEFAGFCFIHKPELANEINTLIANFINEPKQAINYAHSSTQLKEK